MENGIATVAVFGDSILKGIVTGTGSGRMYDIIKEHSLALAAQRLGFDLKNYSVFGNIMTKGQKTLRSQLAKGLQADIAIIEGGGNDCNVNWVAAKDSGEVPRQQVPLADYLRIADEMVGELRERHITPVLTSVVPFVSERWFDQLCVNGDREQILSYLHGDVQYLYRQNELYSAQLAVYAARKGVQLVDIRRYFLELPDFADYMCADGIHPNPRGYAYLADVWVKELPLVHKEF